jgi:hypothetical protein
MREHRLDRLLAFSVELRAALGCEHPAHERVETFVPFSVPWEQSMVQSVFYPDFLFFNKDDTDGVHQLAYIYASMPRVEVRHRSEPHYGAVVLGAPRDSTEGLEGHYFTDRGTHGEMRFRRRFKKLVETHETAGRLAD